MNKLTRKINEWHAQGLIDKQQQELLLNYEQANYTEPYKHKLIILGIVIISLGCCSLVSAHWHLISDETKLTVSVFLNCLFITLSFYYRYQKKSKRSDLYCLLSMLLIFSSIVLTDDYLQLQIKVDKLYLIWSVTCLPVVYGSRMPFSIYLWFAGTLFGTYIKLADINDQLFYNPLGMYVIPPLLCFVFGSISLKRSTASDWTRAWFFYGTLTAIGVVSYIDLNHAVYDSQRFMPTNYLNAYLLSIILMILIQNISTIQKPIRTLCYGAMLIYTVDYTSSHLFASTLYFSVMTLIFLLNVALILFMKDETAYYNTVLSLIGLRLVALFSQSIGGWLKSGISLIATGVMLIIIVSYGKKMIDTVNSKAALIIRKRNEDLSRVK